MAAGDVDAVARLVENLWLPASRQARVSTVERWFRWLENRGGVDGHPMLAVLATILSAQTGRPAEAERWADVADRWQYQDAPGSQDPDAEAWGVVLRRAGLEECWVTSLVCAVQARAAVHRGDVQAARQQLVRAQRLRPLLTYAIPHLAVQARIELTRAHLALADLAGARTLMREIDELLRRRPDLGTLTGEAQALRARLSGQARSGSPGASSLTAAELRIIPLLATHLSFPEISTELFLSLNTIKSQAYSLYRKLGVASRSQAVARSRELGLLEGLGPRMRRLCSVPVPVDADQHRQTTPCRRHVTPGQAEISPSQEEAVCWPGIPGLQHAE